MIGADGDGYHFITCWIGKDGKYYRSQIRKSYADTIISAEELAEELYWHVIENIRYYPNEKLKEAVKNDDFDAVPFLYFSEVIIYNSKYLIR